MASPERVQEYLQSHKVGVIFEELMAKVISDMPEDPVIYLARILHLRAERREGKGLRKSTDLDTSGKKTYDKPWTTNSKKIPPKDLTTKSIQAKRNTRPEWDHKTKNTVSSSLDDLWDDCKLRKSTTPVSKVPAGGVGAWADGKMEGGEEVLHDLYTYSGPRRNIPLDPLAGELGLGKHKENKPPQKSTTIKLSSKKGGRNVDSSRNKSELQSYIAKHEQKSDSGIDDENDHHSDDAIELMENLADLRREGVRNVKQSGVKIRNRQQSSASTTVRVSICATCAKVLGGGVPSQPAAGANFDVLSDYEDKTIKKVVTNQVESSRYDPVASEDDEEFESVSQVTGPRRPVWQDSDTEAVTPKKGKSMLASNLSPRKGLPMFSGDQSQNSSRSHKKSAASPNKSAHFQEHRAPDLNADPMRMTWSPSMGPTQYSEGKPQTSRTVTIATARTEKDDDIGQDTARTGGTGWQVPPDYDTDSSFYGSPGANRPKKFDRAY